MTRNPNLQLMSQESVSSVAPEGWRCNLRADCPELLGPRPEGWWTGKRPSECPGLGADGAVHGTRLPDLSECKRQELLEHFDNAWGLTELLFAGLQGDEAFYRPPYHQLRHPMIFYYGHPATLYVNKLRVAGILDGPLNAYFEQLFETGVDEMSWDDLGKNELPWPAVQEVTAYRRQVYGLVRRVLETHGEAERLPITDRSPLWAVLMGIEHERIHLELSSVLVRELPLQLVRRPEGWPEAHPSAGSPSAHPPERGRDYPMNEMLAAPAGEAVLGKPREWPSYGWDNEYGERRFTVRAFEASRFLVSNGEFWEFVEAGGYQTPQYWTEEGWRWRTYRNVKAPTFWIPDGPEGLHRYRLRLVFESVPMPWNWPAELNWYESKAYCAWRTEREGRRRPYRLLAEPEHNRLLPRPARDAAVPREQDPAMRLDGSEMAAAGLNLGLAWGSPSPVDGLQPDAAGFHDLSGNVWQWCEDHFAALPGFEVHRLYDDFSTPCFDGKHQMILGGSFASTGDEASVWARFQFRPHFFQHAGLRLVRPASVEDGAAETSCMDAPPPHVGVGPCCSRNPRGAARGNVYEGRQMLNEYLMLHYGTEAQTAAYRYISAEVLGFPRRCAEKLARTAAELDGGLERALDIGCAVGGAAFELARNFGQVLAVDLSARFVEASRDLQQHGRLEYERKEEGELHRRIAAVVDPAIDRSRVEFRQADACSLPADLGSFDAVLVANVLCRLPSPRSLLSRLGGPRALVRPGGLLLLTTPYTWMEDFTPRSSWLGGLMRDGRELRSADGLKTQMEAEFELLESEDMPLLIREHSRKFQYIVTAATLWRRHSGRG